MVEMKKAQVKCEKSVLTGPQMQIMGEEGLCLHSVVGAFQSHKSGQSSDWRWEEGYCRVD